jgi:hypothetical protein
LIGARGCWREPPPRHDNASGYCPRDSRAKQAGAAEVEVRMGDQTAIVIRLNLSTGDEKRLEPTEEIIL